MESLFIFHELTYNLLALMLVFFIILLFLVTRYGSWGRIKLYGRMIDKHNNIQAYLARYGL
jgi:hypothetical protein